MSKKIIALLFWCGVLAVASAQIGLEQVYPDGGYYGYTSRDYWPQTGEVYVRIGTTGGKIDRIEVYDGGHGLLKTVPLSPPAGAYLEILHVSEHRLDPDAAIEVLYAWNTGVDRGIRIEKEGVGIVFDEIGPEGAWLDQTPGLSPVLITRKTESTPGEDEFRVYELPGLGFQASYLGKQFRRFKSGAAIFTSQQTLDVFDTLHNYLQTVALDPPVGCGFPELLDLRVGEYLLLACQNGADETWEVWATTPGGAVVFQESGAWWAAFDRTAGLADQLWLYQPGGGLDIYTAPDLSLAHSFTDLGAYLGKRRSTQALGELYELVGEGNNLEVFDSDFDLLKSIPLPLTGGYLGKIELALDWLESDGLLEVFYLEASPAGNEAVFRAMREDGSEYLSQPGIALFELSRGGGLAPKLLLSEFNLPVTQVYGGLVSSLDEAGSAEPELILFPNPSAGRFFVSIPGSGILSVFQTDGRQVTRIPVQAGLYELDGRTWGSGMYWIGWWGSHGSGRALVKMVLEIGK